MPINNEERVSAAAARWAARNLSGADIYAAGYLDALSEEEARAEKAEAELAHLRGLLGAWEREVGAEIPADCKDWHDNSTDEHPRVARAILEARREDRDLAWLEVDRLRKGRLELLECLNHYLAAELARHRGSTADEVPK